MKNKLMVLVFFLLVISVPTIAQDAYILSYFGGSTGKEALNLAYSTDALHWTALNNNKPVLNATLGNKSIRDPYIIRKEDGTFVLMSTDSWVSEYAIFWDSDDLITFKNERIIRMNTMNQHVWAPECIYDPVSQKYIVYWSGDVIYANTTADFKTFSTAKKFFDPGYNCLDADIVSHAGTNYLFYKDGRGTNRDTTYLAFATSKTLEFNSFVPDSFDIKELFVEGPACIKDFDKDRWYLYYDYFWERGIWGCSYSDDLASGKWIKLQNTQFSLPVGVKHGNAVKVTQEELNKIKEKFIIK